MNNYKISERACNFQEIDEIDLIDEIDKMLKFLCLKKASRATF